MIRSCDLYPTATDIYARLQFAGEALPGAPSAAISLISAGDLSIGAADGGAARLRLLHSLGIEPDRVAGLRQVHSKRVYFVPESRESVGAETGGDACVRAGFENASDGYPEGDGLIASDCDRVLSVTVADCLPIFLYDPQNRVRALVHSGWRGTGICNVALAAMQERYGTKAAEVRAIIGPGIGPCCYNVDNERAALFSTSFGGESVVTRYGENFLDLGRANEKLLVDAGVTSILRVTSCTSCSPFLGSFRRQGPATYTHMLALFGTFG